MIEYDITGEKVRRKRLLGKGFRGEGGVGEGPSEGENEGKGSGGREGGR